MMVKRSAGVALAALTLAVLGGGLRAAAQSTTTTVEGKPQTMPAVCEALQRARGAVHQRGLPGAQLEHQLHLTARVHAVARGAACCGR